MIGQFIAAYDLRLYCRTSLTAYILPLKFFCVR